MWDNLAKQYGSTGVAVRRKALHAAERGAYQEADYDWFKVTQAEGFEIPENLVVERHPFDGIAEYIRAKRPEFGAIVVDAGGGSTRIFHEAGTEANLLLVLVAPTKIERRNLVATFDEAERAAAHNPRDVTAHVVRSPPAPAPDPPLQRRHRHPPPKSLPVKRPSTFEIRMKWSVSPTSSSSEEVPGEGCGTV
ncbi:hypothetical protein [Streptomyces sp. NPDC001530]|uniref:hypothetical protein n=1 Tax=Streptomyces sp. NPDC001530 TaxID=3364582 RepID=UPI003694C677